MANCQRTIVLFLLLILTSGLQAQIVVESEEVKAEKKAVYFEYGLSASDMIAGEKFPAGALRIKNATLHKNKGTLFVSADSGVNHATIDYVFDFTKIKYRPIAVDWQYVFNMFGKPNDKRPAVVATASWSTDGKKYHAMTTASNDSEFHSPRGNVTHGKRVKFDHTPDKVYYRVEFKTVNPDKKFIGAMAQWNRTGNNAKLFKARFKLTPLADQVIGDGMSLQVTYPDHVRHLSGKQVYPEDVLSMDSAKRWKFLGAIHGTKGGVELVDAPGRPGEKALLFTVKIKKNNKTPSWMHWQTTLDPQLSIVGTYQTVMDIYPVTPMPFRIMAMYGQHLGFGVIPAVWSSLGKHEPGKWHTLNMKVGVQRRDIDQIRFTFPTRSKEVVDGMEVKFIIDNIRMIKVADPPAVVTIDKMKVHSGLQAGYMQMHNTNELMDDDLMTLSMELGVTNPQQATLKIDVQNLDTNKKLKQILPVQLKAPFTALQLSLTDLLKQLGVGKQQISLQFVDANGRELASSSKPHGFTIYSSAHMNKHRMVLLTRLHKLVDLKNQLEDQGIRVAEPNVTLTVCDWFLKDDGNVVDDFVRQRVCSIAYEQMEYLKGMLDHAETQLKKRQSGQVKELKVDDYQPGVPVQIADGKLVQSGKPIFLIGALGSASHTHLLRDIGFNTQSRETGINRWISKSQDRGIKQFKKFFDISNQYGISTSMLLSSHYKPAPMPSRFAATNSPYTGASMFPWDVLAPNVDAMFDLWYDRMMPYLKNEPSLVSVGTANEPGYSVKERSKTFEAQFRVWAKDQYKKIAVANKLWGSSFTSFASINSPAFFKIREQSHAANYDWLRFVDEQVSGFFGRRKDYLLKSMPSMSVWVKLMGNHHHIGYSHLNEVSNILEGQNVAGTDGHLPMWLDLIKSIDPSRPIINSEWHFLGGQIDLNDQQLIQGRMFDGMTHGICNGLIWKWHRSKWNTKSNGAEQTLTRWARTIDVAGRTALKMRGLVSPISDLGNLDGGKIRLLYSISSTVKMQDHAYTKKMQQVYDSLGRNSQGTRFVFSNMLKAEDLQGVSLLASGVTPCVENQALSIIEQWVKNGGTLWITEPTFEHDPWDRKHLGLPDAFTAAIKSDGTHRYGKGQIVVSHDDAVVASHAGGPWAADANGQFIPTVDIRYLEPKAGQPGYLSILNRAAEPQIISLTGSKGAWGKISQAYDVWNYQQVQLDGKLALDANGVILLQIK